MGRQVGLWGTTGRLGTVLYLEQRWSKKSKMILDKVSNVSVRIRTRIKARIKTTGLGPGLLNRRLLRLLACLFYSISVGVGSLGRQDYLLIDEDYRR